MKRLLIILLGASLVVSMGCVQVRVIDDDGILSDRGDELERDRDRERSERDRQRRGPRSERGDRRAEAPRCKDRCMDEFHQCRETGGAPGPGNSGCAHRKNDCKSWCNATTLDLSSNVSAVVAVE